MKKVLTLSRFCEALDLEIVFKSTDFDDVIITTHDVNRPGLQLAGYYEEFPYQRLQIIGHVEYAYLMSKPPKTRYERFRGILSYAIPALIFSYDQEITQDVKDLANYYNKTLLRSDLPTTKLIARLTQAIENITAEEITLHAGLLEIYGSGILLRGKSSVGKSETGLDLVIRGHRLVADDVVEIRKWDDKLLGSSPENIRHFLEIRGLGILDIQRLYGVGSVKTNTFIDMVIQLETWDDNKEYDRLGLDEQYTEILGVKIPIITVPVKPGRNLAMIIEVATRNQRQKALGYNAAEALTERLLTRAIENQQ